MFSRGWVGRSRPWNKLRGVGGVVFTHSKEQRKSKSKGAFMSNAQSTISPEQQAIFALGEFAGLSSSVTGADADYVTLQAILAALKNAAPTIGTWNVVWGPSVVQQPIGSTYAMNTMYIAQNAAAPSQYVIAIAGT